MRLYTLKPTLFFLLIVITHTISAQEIGKNELEIDRKQFKKSRDKFDWQSLRNPNLLSENIDSSHLSGKWNAYNGLFIFNGVVNSMNLFKPFVIEIKDAAIKRNENSTFIPFVIKDNSIVIKSEKTEEGFINLVTDKILVISWKDGANYTRYYYERSE